MKATKFCVASAYCTNKNTAYFTSTAKTAKGLKRAAEKAAANDGFNFNDLLGGYRIYKTKDYGWIAYRLDYAPVYLDFELNCWY